MSVRHWASTWWARLQEMRDSYRRFSLYARPDRGLFLWDIVSIIVAVVTNAAMIWLMGQPLSLIQAGDFASLPSLLALFAGVLLVNQAAQMLGGWLTSRMALNYVGRLRKALMSRLFVLSYPVAGRVPRGDLLARLSNDVDRVTEIWVDARLQLVSHLLTLLIYVSLLFWINSGLALVAMATVPVFVLHQRFFSRRKHEAASKFLRSNGELLAFEEQGLANLRGIASNNAESLMARLHDKVFQRVYRWALRERVLEVAFQVSFTLLVYLVGLLVVVVGVREVSAGTLPVGLLVSFVLYLGYLTVPLRGLADLGFQLAGNRPAALRLSEVLDAEPQVAELPQAAELAVPAGGIVIDDVDFSYDEGAAQILKGANVEIRPGESVALVGPSGCGKSTLAALLLRFYDPQRGRILIDGQDLRAVTVASIRRQVAVVWQEPLLIQDSLRANLLMARPEATQEELETACRRSHAWSFIQALPQGLDTRLGGEVELSGGQKQRLAIAQAFLRDAPILILDEASSALDSHAEQAIVRDLAALRAGRTTLMIAHRHSSLRAVDRVIYLEGDGSLTIERHEVLLATHPAYREAVAWQTGEGDKAADAKKATE